MSYAAIFDLDGTLVDTPRAIVRTFTATFAELGYTTPDPGEIRATIGLPLEQAFSKLMNIPADEPQIARAVAQYQRGFREIVLPGAAELVFPGVTEGLATLADQGVSLAVATSKFHRSADALLVAAGLRSHFTLVMGADQVSRPKPDPEMGEMIMRELGVLAERAVMIGDTTHDVLMATAAGMRSIAVTYGVHSEVELRAAGPDWVADSFGSVVRFAGEAFGIQTGGV